MSYSQDRERKIQELRTDGTSKLTSPFIHSFFTMATIPMASKKMTLIMGVANKRSIAWARVGSFMRTNHYDCILTYQSERFRDKVDKMVLTANAQHLMNNQNQSEYNNNYNSTSIIASLPCNVQTDLPTLFHERLPDYLEQGDRKIDAVVQSLAYANFEGHADKLSQASWQAYIEA
jgi:enoyl-[acyl-carrier-protein] reductase (NADH)